MVPLDLSLDFRLAEAGNTSVACDRLRRYRILLPTITSNCAPDRGLL